MARDLFSSTISGGRLSFLDSVRPSFDFVMQVLAVQPSPLHVIPQAMDRARKWFGRNLMMLTLVSNNEDTLLFSNLII